MRLDGATRLLVVLSLTWLVVAAVVAWFSYPTITTDFAIVRSRLFWALSHANSAGSPFQVDANGVALFILFAGPIVVLWMLYAAGRWVARGSRTNDA
jgi:hypothetical protein